MYTISYPFPNEFFDNDEEFTNKHKEEVSKVNVKFWCNAGHTEEEVTIEIYNGENEENEIEKAFHKWLDNNENCGWEKI